MSNYNKVSISKTSKITMPSNTDSGISVKSVVNYNKQILIGACNNTFSLIKGSYDSSYNISNTQNLITYSNKPVRFVGNLCEHYGFIPKSQLFKLKYSNFDDAKCYDVTLDNANDLTSSVISLIKNTDACITKCGCSHNKCFKFVGFFLRATQIHLIIQLFCHRKTKSKKLYIVTGDFNPKKMVISHNLSMSGIYDLYASSKQNCISKDEAKEMHFGGISYSNNIMYLLTKTNSKGWLWKVRISKSFNFFNSMLEPLLNKEQTKIFVLENDPVGLSHMSKNELIVLENEYCNNKIPYKILTLE
jgi:hypothetical protein